MSDAKPEGTSKLLVRVVVGAIYAVVVVGCLYMGLTSTAVVVSAMATMCAWELLSLFRGAGRQPNDIIVLAASLLYPLAPLAPNRVGTMAITILLLLACAVWYVSVPRVTITDVALTVFIPLYCGFAFSSVTMIRAFDRGLQGFLLTFGVMGSIWLNDSAAYFVGSSLGKHKLAPRISPNKSIEGFWGGIVACTLTWVLLVILKVRGLKIYMAIPFGIIVGLTAVIGDLFESRIKRGFGVKDSGKLMPGHGGMLDRSDALLLGTMVAFLLLRFGGIV